MRLCYNPDMSTSNQEIKILLASQSPRRSELLKLIGKPFDVEPANINENMEKNEEPYSYTKRLALSKSLKVARNNVNGSIVIGADTIVVHDNKAVGKPTNNKEAYQILMKLRGHTHQVVTAVAIHYSKLGITKQDLCETNVQMRNMTEEEVADYISTGDSLDKAGAYAIQNVEFKPAVPLGGCMANVIGLPLCHITRALREKNIHVDKDIAEKCQDHIGYDCPVYKSILES